jgi:hypothetical protein
VWNGFLVTKPKQKQGSAVSYQGNSNRLANQHIHLILAKQEKLASNSLANQLGKNRILAKLIFPLHICTRGSWLPSGKKK